MDKKKILIADDERDVLSVLKKSLSTEGYSVIEANSGRNVLALAKLEHPNLIILDLEMADMYGGDVARKLKEDPEMKHIPVMFLTGMFPKESEPERGWMIADHMLFAKPYDMKILAAAIRGLLENKIEDCLNI